jgi:hypothetical protein
LERGSNYSTYTLYCTFMQAAWHLYETEVKGVAGLQKGDGAGDGGKEGGEMVERKSREG